MPNTKIILLVLLPVLSLVIGAVEHRVPETNTFVVIHWFVGLAIVFAWFHLDAVQREYRSSIPLKVSMVALTVIALPYYLFRSRGAVDGLKAFGLTLLLLVVTMTGYRLGWSLF